jgi:uncharacterized membrane protein YedE/YeeE
MALLLAGIVLGMILGFAAHRASVCTVRAIAEIMSARSAYMLASIGKSVLWVWAVTFPILVLFPAAIMGVNGWQFTALALAGGFAFGLGAALNGGCAYSTMSRLVDGETAMLVAIVGFALGTAGFAFLAGWQWLPRPQPAPILLRDLVPWVGAIAIAVVAWAVYEAIRLWRTREAGTRVADLVLARRYRLSTAALVMGISGSLLFLSFGPFGYTATFELIVEGALGSAGWPPLFRWVVLFSVLAGMLVSTLQRGTFQLDWRPRRAWLLHFGGGLLMGFGTALAPGGNDALVMYGIPILSPYALPTYLALCLGVAAGLLIMRAFLGMETRAEFRDDMFIGDSWSRPMPPGKP